MLYRMMDDGRWKLATGTQRLTLAPGGWTCDGKPISKNEYLLADAGWRLVSWRWGVQNWASEKGGPCMQLADNER